MKSLAVKLIEQGRLDEAIKCYEHAEILEEIDRVKLLKENATDKEDYELAIQYKDLLTNLDHQLCTSKELEKWIKPFKNTNFKDLENSVIKEFGEDSGIEFHEKFHMKEITCSLDIHDTKQIFVNAQAYFIISQKLVNNIEIFSQQSDLILDKIFEDLGVGKDILLRLKYKLPELTNDIEFQTYSRAIIEVFSIAERMEHIFK